MSAIFKTQGGSGGFFPSIFVTGLSETDTVYAAKDGKTVRGKWETRTVDEIEVSGFLISPLRDLGMWTVTATDGVKTVTQDVLVDVITQYEIELYLNRLYLYREGDECKEVTGGWQSYSNGAQQQYAVFETKNEIDTTGYSELHIIVERYSADTSSATGISNGLVRPSGNVTSSWFGWREDLVFGSSGLGVGEAEEWIIPLDEKTIRSGYIIVGNVGDTSRSSTMTVTKNFDHLFTQHYVSSTTYWNKWHAVWLE